MAEKVLGIDFGSAGLKIAEVSIDKGAVTVLRQAYMPLADGVATNGAVRPENVELVASDLKAFLAGHKFTSRDAVMGINSAADVYVNRAVTPWHEPRNYRTAVGFDIVADESLLLGAPEAVIIDAVVFGELTEGEHRKVDALLIGVGEKLVQTQLQILQKAGLNAAGADLAGLASLRATWIANRSGGALDVLVDIGKDVTSVLIHENGKPYALTLHRDCSGADLDKLIAASLQDEDQDRITREKVSFSRDYRVQQAIDKYAFKLTATIKGAVASYQATRPEDPAAPAGLTLIGAGALVHNLPAVLQEATGWRTMTGRYAIDISGEPERHHLGPILSNDYTAAVGLAMGATA